MKHFPIAIFILLINALLSSGGVPVERIVPKVRILSVTELEEGLENEVREPSRNNQKAQAKAGIVDLNLWTDGVINTVARGILYGNLDPVLVSGYSIKFDYRPLLITYSGTLTLTQGSIQGLSSITRGGNALMPSDTLITVPLRFSNVILSYNFEMNVRGDTVTGVLYTWLTDPSATYQRYISPTINSYGFNLNIGSFDILLFSGDISGSYSDLVRELSTDVMKSAVTSQTSVTVSKLLNDLISYESFQ